MEGTVGRRDEMEAIRGTITSASDSSAALLVEGEAGIGKSHLLRTVQREAAADGMAVLHAGITEAESTISWAGMSTLVDSLEEYDSDLFTAAQRHLLDRAQGRTTGSPVDAHDVAGALADVIGRVASSSPTLLLLDDLHWLDRASAAALSVAIRANLRHPVAIVAARRRHCPIAIELDRFNGLPVEHLSLGGLSVGGVYELLDAHGLTGIRRPDVVRIHELSQGNPLFAIELAKLHVDGRRPSDIGGHDALRDVAAARLDRVGPAAIEAARVSALLTQPTIGNVRSVIGPDADDGLLELEREGIITCDGDRVLFSHPLRREGILDGIGALERSRYHLRIAAIIDDTEQSVSHRGAAAQSPDAELAGAMERIADIAADRGARDVARARYRLAEQLTPITETHDRWRRAHRAMHCTIALGDDLALDEAVRLFEQAVGLDAILEASLDVIEVSQRTEGLNASATWGLTGRARLASSPSHEVQLLERIVRIEQLRDIPAAAELARTALELALATGDDHTIDRARVLAASTAVLAGEPFDLETVAHVPIGQHTAGVDAATFVVELLVWTHQFDRAEALLREMEVDARASGRSTQLVRALSQLGDLNRRHGNWDDCVVQLREAIETGELIGYDAGARPDLAWILAARGHHDLALDLAHQAAQLVESAPTLHRVHVEARQGFVHLAAGDWRTAVTFLAGAREEAAAIGFAAPAALPIDHDLVEASIQVGDVELAHAAATSLLAAANRSGDPFVAALSSRSSALVAGARGDADEAVRLALHAIALHADGPNVPFEAARAHLVAGAALRRAGRRRDARDHFGTALAMFERLDAQAFVQRARSQLDRLGTRQTSTGLSPTEERVADMAARGRTNVEISNELAISVRTVESNLTRVYRKLGVRSRTELATKLVLPA